MKLDFAKLASFAVTPPAAFSLVGTSENLYTLAGLEGVLLRRLSDPRAAWACNGAIIFCHASGGGTGFSYEAGAFIGYIGDAWRRVVAGELELGITHLPIPIANGSPAKHVGSEIASVKQYVGSGQSRVFHHSYSRSTEFNSRNNLVNSGIFTVAELNLTKFTIMEIVTGADDGVFTRAGDSPLTTSANTGGATGNIHGYLSTSVTLPPLHTLITRNAAVLKALFPEEVQSDFDDVFLPFTNAYEDRAVAPTLAFWTDVSDGAFGVPMYVPKVNGAVGAANEPTDYAIFEGITAEGTDLGKQYLYSDWPGKRMTVATYDGILVGTSHLDRAFHAISGMLSVIDVNALRRGQSPHLVGVVHDSTTIHALADVVDPNPFEPPTSSAIDEDVFLSRAATAEAAEDMRTTYVDNKGWYRDWVRSQHLSSTRVNLGTLSAHLDAYVGALTDAIEAHARAAAN